MRSWLRVLFWILGFLVLFFLSRSSQCHLVKVWWRLQSWSLAGAWIVLWRDWSFLCRNFHFSCWSFNNWSFNFFGLNWMIFLKTHSVIFSCNDPISDWNKVSIRFTHIFMIILWSLSALLNEEHSLSIDIFWIIFLDLFDGLRSVLQ